MKRFKSMSLKKKRALAIAGVSIAILAVGGTIAYNQTVAVFNNKFNLKGDEIEAVDVVPPVDHWQPCEEYPKTAVVKNKNNTPRYVRTKIIDYWRVQNSQQTDHETSDLPMTWTDGSGTHKYAFYNLQNEDKWTLAADGYYYYNDPLAPGATTESLLKSAKFNCDANLAGEMTYSQDGHVAQNTQSNYSDSEYHVYVIFEIKDIPFPPPQHIADCSDKVLYDTIACLTNGPDDGIDFSEEGTAGNGLGVNTLSAHKDDNYPVYYYRGKTVDNHVVFGGFCWRAMQTTGTGGVKLLYNGVVNNQGGEQRCLDFSTAPIQGMPPALGNASGVWYNTYSTGTINNLGGHYAPHVGGYMYHPLEQAPTPASTRVLGSDVRWDGSSYTLVDPILIDPSQVTDDEIINTHRYYCGDMTSITCTKVAFNLDYNIYIHHYYLENGMKYDDAMHSNTVASEAKDAFEEWYARSLTSYASKIEDTIYCNDRSLADDGLDGYDYMYKMKYNVYVRNSQTYKPSIDCIDKRDAFTVSSTIGNGANNYPIGTMTADDVTLAGNVGYMQIDTNVNSTWTMSPYVTDNDEYAFWSYLYGQIVGSSGYNKGILRPVISLKAGIKYTTGDGTKDAPFVIE